MASNVKKTAVCSLDLKKVKKRDGSLDSFDSHKISLAIEKCFKNGIGSSDEEAQAASAKVTKTVVNIFTKKDEVEIEVESIQKVIIQQLWALGYFDAAEQYTLFKEKRRQERIDHPVDPALQQMVEEDRKYFPTALQYYQFISKFSKWNEVLGRRETWGECVDRVMNFFSSKEFYGKLSEEDDKDLRAYLQRMDATPAMRVIQMAGPALERCEVGVYNCSYLPICDIKSFSELLYILMQGTGAGFSVERQYVNLIPPVIRQTGKAPKKITVIDDTEGWCDALDAGLNAWVSGKDVEFDFSNIRASGTRLKTKGGRASGPGPLMELMAFAKNLILSKQGESLSDIDCHDLACKVGKIVQVGGVRRASEISLSDLNSTSMRDAKSGTWWNNNLQRTMANNSAVYVKKPSDIEFMEEWTALAKSGSGERGIFNREGVNASLPKRRKPNTFGTNPCVPKDTWVHTSNGPRQVHDLINTPFTAMVNGKEHHSPTGFIKTGTKLLKQISLKGGISFKATDNHKVMVIEYQSRKKQTTKWVEVKDLTTADRVVLHNHRGSVFGSADDGSHKTGWLLGSLAGDGNITADGNANLDYWGVNAEHMRGLAVSRVHSEVGGRSDLKGVSIMTVSGKEKTRVQSKNLGSLAKQYGLTGVCKAIGKEIESTTSEFHSGFLQGWFDADGSVQGTHAKGVSIRLTSVSLTNLQAAQRMLARLGVISSIYKFRRQAGSRLLPDGKGGNAYYPCQALHELVIANDNLLVYAEVVGFSDPSKIAKLEKLLGEYKNKHDRERFCDFVESIQTSGVEDVYDCSVPGPSSFDANGCYLHNCAEIILRPYQFCNLSIVVARENDTAETLAKKVRIATIFGTMQSCLTNFKYIRKEWRDNCEEERLLGVDITGQMDCPLLRPGSPGREKLLASLKNVVSQTNEEYAKKFGIPRSAADTCVKPSGDSAVMFGCSSGIHARFSDYYIRRVREKSDSPVAHMLIDAGVPWIPAAEDPALLAFEFPCASPKGAIIKTQQTAIDQLDNWLTWKRHWAEHSVSATIYVEPGEWLSACQWVYKNFDEVSGISFLPRDNGTYTSTPYEEIDEAEYKRRVEAFPQVDWAKLSRYEKTDQTESAQTYACTSGVCEL